MSLLRQLVRRQATLWKTTAEAWPHEGMELFCREAQFFDAGMGGSKLLDGHIEQRLIRSGLLSAYSDTPLIEALISFEKEDHLGIIGDFVGTFWVFSEVPVKLHS
jgi:hypothetical protein